MIKLKFCSEKSKPFQNYFSIRMGKNYDKNQSKKSCDTLPLKKGVCHENCDPIFKCGFGSPRYS